MSDSARPVVSRRELRKVITASSAGTLIEWYDFFVYGSLAVVFSGFFFPAGNGPALLVRIAAFGTGFVVRPVGAVVFGRLGDRLGRKKILPRHTAAMGAATALSGCCPPIPPSGSWRRYSGRCGCSGTAVGGEYGGAAVYVAENSPAEPRGTYTSFLQTTATGGLLLSILVVVACRTLLGEEAFATWGWRVPFLLSAVLWSSRSSSGSSCTSRPSSRR